MSPGFTCEQLIKELGLLRIRSGVVGGEMLLCWVFTLLPRELELFQAVFPAGQLLEI